MKKVLCVLVLVVSLILVNVGAYTAAYATDDGSTITAYDNRIKNSDPNAVYADRKYFDVGRVIGCSIYRGYLWFDLSNYTDPEKVTKATISLYTYPLVGKDLRIQPTILEVYRPKSWQPDSVSWNMRNNGAAWKNPGGDWFDVNDAQQGYVPYATVTIPVNPDQTPLPDYTCYTLDVTDLVKKYVSGECDNTGFFLRASAEGKTDYTYISLCSLEYPDASVRPQLTVEYAQ